VPTDGSATERRLEAAQERVVSFGEDMWFLRRGKVRNKPAKRSTKHRYRLLFDLLDNDGGSTLDVKELLQAMRY
jgi:hypothetical protein